MTGHQADRITLELEPGEPIHGTLRDQAGATHAFRGWLELCAALDRAWQRTTAPGNDEQRQKGGL
jgi:hypothetical protein